MAIISRNPATEEVLANFEEYSAAQIESGLVCAAQAFDKWRSTSFTERAKLVNNLASVLRAEKESLGRLATLEMGKPFAAAVAEVEKCAWVCEYYAQEAAAMLQPQEVVTDAGKSYVRFDPLGIVLAVMPWNFPFWQVMRFAAPAIMAGNVAILKHASNVPQCARAIEAVFLRSGFPNGVFQTFMIGSSAVSGLISDPRIQAITLTGSENAGREVAGLAGREIKKTVLELGGSDPFIVLADADISLACATGAVARLQNAGQSCIAAKRFIVVESVLEEFLSQYRKIYEVQALGDPFDPATTVGPLATAGIRDGIVAQVERSVAMGAEIVIGGGVWGDIGYFYLPTIVRNVKKGMPLYDEEVFGPVAAIIAARDAEDAIRIANDSPLGLGASLWTKNLFQAEEYAARIDSGSVFINGMVKSDPRLPFGGIKKSGYGRELADYGIKEFVNVKTIWIGKGAVPEVTDSE